MCQIYPRPHPRSVTDVSSEIVGCEANLDEALLFHKFVVRERRKQHLCQILEWSNATTLDKYEVVEARKSIIQTVYASSALNTSRLSPKDKLLPLAPRATVTRRPRRIESKDIAIRTALY